MLDSCVHYSKKSRYKESPSTESRAAGISLMRKCSKAFELLTGYARVTAISEEHYDYMTDCLCAYLVTGYARIHEFYNFNLLEEDFVKLRLVPAGAIERPRFYSYSSAHFPLSSVEWLPEMRALMRLSCKLFLPESLINCHLRSCDISTSLTELVEQDKMIDRVLSLKWYSRTKALRQEPSKFSTGSKRYFVQGKAGSRSVEALPDTVPHIEEPSLRTRS
jgi:hypothetical protein